MYCADFELKYEAYCMSMEWASHTYSIEYSHPYLVLPP
jgi:hypothetical protein